MMKSRVSFVSAVLVALSLSACQLSDDGEPTSAGEEPALGELAQAVTVPPKGAPSTLDIGSWNLEWFGDAANAPTNDPLQLSNVHDVIAGADLDIWGLEEVVSTAQFNTLKAQLPGYSGFLANDPIVTNGAAFYSDFNNAEQKVGILYKSSVATLLSATVVLTQNNTDFAGRPPMEVKLRITLNGNSEDVVFIVMHPKCCTDSASYQRRVAASNALKAYLDATYPTQKVWVIGDWNDDVDTSISTGNVSPYRNFVLDSARYTVETKALSDTGIASTVNFTDMIDHHMVSNEVAASYIASSVEVYRVDAFVPSYGTTTSDHYPVLSRYTFAAGTTPSLTITSPNGGGSYVAGSVQNITWTSALISNLRLEYTLDGGVTWSLITASTPAAAGSFAWTVPATASTNAKVRATDTASALSDSSDAAFAIVAGGGTANVVINEILANEPGSATAGEFIEIVNIGTAAAAIGGWTLSDSVSVRHTFAAGATLAPGQAIVVFGGASGIPAGVANAVASSSGALSLSNSGDTVTLRNGTTVIGSVAYTSALANVDGVSMNRNPDGGTVASYVLHTALVTASASPGTRANGGAF
jgi:endonuclease/exonuclease/phosphatase family metal-dependent hydrolase